MKKFGFTLAEVLITLGIIGVIAALTTPALVKNTGSAKIGPTLAKFVNTFETGAEQLLASNEVRSYTGGINDMTLLSKHIIMTPVESSYYFKSGSGTSEGITSEASAKEIMEHYRNIIQNNPHIHISQPHIPGGNANAVGVTIWQLKDGSVMAIIPAENENIAGTKGIYKGIVAEVIYDIDGNKDGRDNIAGKDVYEFLLDKTGILVPVGSAAHKNIGQNGKRFVTVFSDECNTSSDSLAQNFACTGKIADNNYKS